MQFLKRYIREPVNGLTHLIGTLLSIVGLILLLQNAGNSTTHFTAFSMFGCSMILLYTSSTLYHSLNVKESALLWLQQLDHSMIYVLIAGSYTPICLLVLDDSWRWIVFIAVWGLALAGIIKKLFWFRSPGWFSLALYLGMSWLGVLLFPVLFTKLPPAFMIWFLAGGIAYTLGAIIYGLRKPNPIPGWIESHEIWHLFVMIGTFSHFWAFYQYLSGFGL